MDDTAAGAATYAWLMATGVMTPEEILYGSILLLVIVVAMLLASRGD